MVVYEYIFSSVSESALLSCGVGVVIVSYNVSGNIVVLYIHISSSYLSKQRPGSSRAGPKVNAREDPQLVK
jgi:hypothetical protein